MISDGAIPSFLPKSIDIGAPTCGWCQRIVKAFMDLNMCRVCLYLAKPYNVKKKTSQWMGLVDWSVVYFPSWRGYCIAKPYLRQWSTTSAYILPQIYCDVLFNHDLCGQSPMQPRYECFTFCVSQHPIFDDALMAIDSALSDEIQGMSFAVRSGMGSVVGCRASDFPKSAPKKCRNKTASTCINCFLFLEQATIGKSEWCSRRTMIFRSSPSVKVAVSWEHPGDVVGWTASDW